MEENEEVWLTRIGFKIKHKKKMVETCHDINKLDSTFIYSLVKYAGKQRFDWMLVIKSSTKDQAYQRGSWFRYKVIDGLTYSVCLQ